jgi:DNA phosphorothioation-associated putative methyltransferase
LALDDGLITTTTSVLDYGCGRGADLRHLESLGVRVAGWDPVHLPGGNREPSDVVNLGYVINVIEKPDERRRCLLEAWTATRQILIVSARLSEEMQFLASETPFEDGCLTGAGTFQKFYSPSELRAWVDETLGTQCVVAAPGVVYVFRDATLEQSYLSSRYRQRTATPQPRISDILFDQHRGLLEPLMRFVSDRGRLPSEAELPEFRDISSALGSVKRAFALVKRVTGPDQWDAIRARRRDDLLVYVAMTRFSARPRFSELPDALRLDVRAHASSYSDICSEADALLFSVGDLDHIRSTARSSLVGKKLPTAIYVHVSALPYLPVALRVYEGCARAYVGAVESANIVKLHVDKPQVTYLAYPRFDEDPHPSLAGYLLVPLQGQSLQYRDYAHSTNPPILHRKELFIDQSHPLRETFATLTAHEEARGLFMDATRIGFLSGWLALLAQRNLCIVGHSLVETCPPKPTPD